MWNARALATLFTITACASLEVPKLPDAAKAQAELFECRTAALADLVGPTIDAVKLARDIEAGKANIAMVVEAIDPTAEALSTFVNALQACLPAEPAPTDNTDA